ncbi:MAG: DUF2914 domain-containing protein [Geobacteraceae bacterium]|jgi:hypothetical protein
MNTIKTFSSVCCLVLIILSGALTVQAADNGLKITEMTVTTKIVKGNPIDAVHRISSASVKVLYCFTRLDSTTGAETSIRHVWYRNSDKAGEYRLPVKGEHWRTFSKKMISKGWAGDWRVEALDSEGHLLKTVKFRMN